MPDHIHIQYLHFTETSPGAGTIDAAWLVLARDSWPLPTLEHASIAVREGALVYESLCDNDHTPLPVLQAMAHRMLLELAWRGDRRRQRAWTN